MCHLMQFEPQGFLALWCPWLLVLAFDELDRTTRYIRDAKARALEVLNEASPKLTALEKALWMKLKRGERPCKNSNGQYPRRKH